MKKYLILLVALFSVAISSCRKVVGRGPIISETRTVNDFSKINLSLDATVYYTQDSHYSVEVEAEENILEEVQTQVSGSTLTIKKRNSVWLKTESIRVIIHAPSITDIEVEGSGYFLAQQPMNTSNIALQISGSGEIVLPALISSQVEADISGSGSIEIKSGECQSVETCISGSGEINFIGLRSQSANCTTTGSGKTKVYVEDNLIVRITGSGDVWYRGNPHIESTITGSGSMKPYF